MKEDEKVLSAPEEKKEESKKSFSLFKRFAGGKTKGSKETDAGGDVKKEVIRRRLVIGVLAALIAIILIIILLFLLFRVKSISVKSTIPEERLISVSEVRIGDPVITLNDSDILGKIQTAYPYVTGITLTRSLSGDIEIKTYESTPVFCAKVYDKYLTLTADLRVLETYPSEEKALASSEGGIKKLTTGNLTKAVSGEEIKFEKSGYDASVSDFIYNIISTPQFADIDNIDVSSRFDYKFVYKDRIRVSFGKDINTPEKLEFLEKIYEKLEDGVTGELDLADVKKAYFIPDDE